MRTLARAQDATIRDPEGPLEAMAAGIPSFDVGGQKFGQQTVAPRLDVFGQPRERPTSGLNAAINPFNPSAPTENPVEKELEGLQLKGYDVQPGFVGKTMGIAGQNIELRPEQQRAYQSVSGKIAYPMLQMLVGSQEWKAATDQQKMDAVESVVRNSREATREGMKPGMFDQYMEQVMRAYRQRGELPEGMTGTGG